MVTPFFCLGDTCPSGFIVTGLTLLLLVSRPFLTTAAAVVVSSPESRSSSMGEMVWSLSS